MEVLSEKYFVINSKFEFSEYATLEQALKANDCRLVAIRQWVNFSTTVHRGSSSQKEERQKFHFEFASPEVCSRSAEFKVGKWTASYNGSSYNDKMDNFKAIFSAYPEDGEIKLIEGVNNRGLYSIIEHYKRLHELATYKCWEHYGLACENEKLKQENALLKTQLKDLKETDVEK